MAVQKGDSIRKKTLPIWWGEKLKRNPKNFNGVTYEQINRIFTLRNWTNIMIADLIGRNRNDVAVYRQIWEEER